MRIDPTIERIRQIRHEISEECDHNTHQIVEYYIKYQQKFHDELIRKSSIKNIKTDEKEMVTNQRS